MYHFNIQHSPIISHHPHVASSLWFDFNGVFVYVRSTLSHHADFCSKMDVALIIRTVLRHRKELNEMLDSSASEVDRNMFYRVHQGFPVLAFLGIPGFGRAFRLSNAVNSPKAQRMSEEI